MKICSICCKPLINTETEGHSRCLKNLFNINYLPQIHLSLSELSITAQQMVGKLSVSGVQPKLSVKLNKKNRALEVIAEGGEYIVKPQVQTYCRFRLQPATHSGK
jgi:serine/threonine-protein kinase HipA